MKQTTLASAATAGFDKHRKITPMEQFLAEINAILPWGKLVGLVEQHYYSHDPTKAGRPPIGAERMLRIHLLQHWYGYSDPAVENMLYLMPVLREFVGIDLGAEPVPDETTICKFRHRMEKAGLGKQVFALINAFLGQSGIAVKDGKMTMVDATIIKAPMSTKNKDKKRDPDMRFTKKGGQMYFGMKAHIGADTKTGLVHSVSFTAANAHDSTEIPNLLHGEEIRVYGDSAYTGKKQTIQAVAPNAKDFTNQRGRRNHPLTDKEKLRNSVKSRTRAKVEHPFRILKCMFGNHKTRYRGMLKNANHLHFAMAMVNIYMVRRELLSRCPAPPPQPSCA